MCVSQARLGTEGSATTQYVLVASAVTREIASLVGSRKLESWSMSQRKGFLEVGATQKEEKFLDAFFLCPFFLSFFLSFFLLLIKHEDIESLSTCGERESIIVCVCVCMCLFKHIPHSKDQNYR